MLHHGVDVNCRLCSALKRHCLGLKCACASSRHLHLKLGVGVLAGFEVLLHDIIDKARERLRCDICRTKGTGRGRLQSGKSVRFRKHLRQVRNKSSQVPFADVVCPNPNGLATDMLDLTSELPLPGMFDDFASHSKMTREIARHMTNLLWGLRRRVNLDS